MSNSLEFPGHAAVRKGATALVVAVFLMSLSDAIVKWLSQDVTLWQIYSLRGLVAVSLLCSVTWRRGGKIRPTHAGWVGLRSLLLVLTWVAYYSALPVLDFSTAAVLVYASPLMITVLSIPLFKEQFRLNQWAAVGLGFAGVLIIVRPGPNGLSLYAFLPLLAALLYSLSMVLTRLKCRDEDPLVLSLWMNSGMLILGVVAIASLWLFNPTSVQVDEFAFLLTLWRPLTLTSVLAIAGLGVLISIYVGMVAKAYQIAPPSAMAPFDYMYLVFAAVWSWLLFSSPPDAATIIGGGLIAASGLLALRK